MLLIFVIQTGSITNEAMQFIVNLIVKTFINERDFIIIYNVV